MAQPHISCNTAILINTNIMLGTGVFINTAKLADATGVLSPLVYVAVGILLYPLIAVFTRLQATLPRGSLYDFGALIHPFVGFLSSWGYYVGKLASGYLGIHVFVHIITQYCPWLPPIPCELALIGTFVWLYSARITVTTAVQYLFMICKLFPLVFVILLGSWWFSQQPLVITYPEIWTHFPATVPFVLFSFAGFEASCSLSQSLPNPQKDAPQVIYTSYILAVSISMLYQTGSWLILGNNLAASSSYLSAFADILHETLPSHVVAIAYIIAVGAIATSALGASYSIVFSNTWNLYILATNKYVWFSRVLSRLNVHNMPSICGILTGCILLGYLLWSYGDTGPLQQMGAVGATWAYTISICAWLYNTKRLTPLLCFALLSSSIFIIATVQSGITYGAHAYIIFASLLLVGSLMYATYTSQTEESPENIL